MEATNDSGKVSIALALMPDAMAAIEAKRRVAASGRFESQSALALRPIDPVLARLEVVGIRDMNIWLLSDRFQPLLVAATGSV